VIAVNKRTMFFDKEQPMSQQLSTPQPLRF
jgi:hypothetical protein